MENQRIILLPSPKLKIFMQPTDDTASGPSFSNKRKQVSLMGVSRDAKPRVVQNDGTKSWQASHTARSGYTDFASHAP
jgi:hypothetical protein